MQFKYFPSESKLVDLLFFPLSVKLENPEKSKSKSDNYAEYVPEDIIKTFTDLESALKPYEPEIDHYYFEEFSFPSFLIKSFPPFGYINELAYLDALSNAGDEALKSSMITKLYSLTHEDEPASDDLIATLQYDLNDQMALIEKLSASDETKWKVMGFLRAPKSSTEKWIALIKKLMPLFDSFYSKRESEARSLGERFEKALNDSNGATLKEITNGFIGTNLLQNGNFLISLTQPLAIEINESSSIPFLKIGVDIESFLQQLKNAQASELKARVLLFKNLGDQTRYDVVRLIASGVSTAKEIAETLGVSQATISYHISNLVTSNILILEKTDNKYAYRINFEQLERAYKAMLEDFARNPS